MYFLLELSKEFVKTAIDLVQANSVDLNWFFKSMVQFWIENLRNRGSWIGSGLYFMVLDWN